MIITERDIHHWPDNNLAGHHDGPVLYLVHAEDSALGRVQNGRTEKRAENSPVGDREGTARKIGNIDPVVFDLFCEIGNCLLKGREPEPAGISDYRHDKAALGPDRDTYVIIIMIDDFISLDESIGLGHFLQGGDACLDEKGHKSKPDSMFLPESFPELLSE